MGGSSLSEHDVGRKQAVERDIESSPDALQMLNAVFDDSGNFLVTCYMKLCHGRKIIFWNLTRFIAP